MILLLFMSKFSNLNIFNNIEIVSNNYIINCHPYLQHLKCNRINDLFDINKKLHLLC